MHNINKRNHIHLYLENSWSVWGKSTALEKEPTISCFKFLFFPCYFKRSVAADLSHSSCAQLHYPLKACTQHHVTCHTVHRLTAYYVRLAWHHFRDNGYSPAPRTANASLNLSSLGRFGWTATHLWIFLPGWRHSPALGCLAWRHTFANIRNSSIGICLPSEHFAGYDGGVLFPAESGPARRGGVLARRVQAPGKDWARGAGPTMTPRGPGRDESTVQLMTLLRASVFVSVSSLAV